MRSRRVMEFVGKLALAAMLFAQAAFALAACDLIGRTPAYAIAPVSNESGKARCHDADGGANLCVAHCQTENQSLDKPQIKVPAFAFHPVLAVRAPEAPRFEAIFFARHPVARTGPPPRILFQSFLI